MWQHHLMIVSALLLMALPVQLLDRWLLRPSGDIFLINLRGMLTTSYAAWLAVHIPLTSLTLYLLETDRLYTLHGAAALASAGLLIGGLKVRDRIEARRARAQREARMTVRLGLFDAIKLEKWWYVPGAGVPEGIGAILVVGHSGRLAASVEGRTAGKDDRTVYAGEMKPQQRVQAGDRIEYVFPLRYYGEGEARDVRFRLALFRDRRGSAPEDLFKTYATARQTTDDGKHFYDILPPAAPSGSG